MKLILPGDPEFSMEKVDKVSEPQLDQARLVAMIERLRTGKANIDEAFYLIDNSSNALKYLHLYTDVWSQVRLQELTKLGLLASPLSIVSLLTHGELWKKINPRENESVRSVMRGCFFRLPYISLDRTFIDNMEKWYDLFPERGGSNPIWGFAASAYISREPIAEHMRSLIKYYFHHTPLYRGRFWGQLAENGDKFATRAKLRILRKMGHEFGRMFKDHVPTRDNIGWIIVTKNGVLAAQFLALVKKFCARDWRFCRAITPSIFSKFPKTCEQIFSIAEKNCARAVHYRPHYLRKKNIPNNIKID